MRYLKDQSHKSYNRQHQLAIRNKFKLRRRSRPHFAHSVTLETRLILWKEMWSKHAASANTFIACAAARMPVHGQITSGTQAKATVVSIRTGTTKEMFIARSQDAANRHGQLLDSYSSASCCTPWRWPLSAWWWCLTFCKVDLTQFWLK